MKTSALIRQLSENLKPQKQAISDVRFLAYAIAVMFFIFSALLYLLPLREDLSAQVRDAHFDLESFFWLILALSSAVVAYRSALLPSAIRKFSNYALASFIALLMALLFREDFLNIKNEFIGEFVFKRGGCGLCILMISTLASMAFCFWVRRFIPTQIELTLLWAGLSAGFLAIFVMQFFCFHSNPMHIFIWHFTPVLMTAISGSFIGARFLRQRTYSHS
jgi:hypothetical protein